MDVFKQIDSLADIDSAAFLYYTDAPPVEADRIEQALECTRVNLPVSDETLGFIRNNTFDIVFIFSMELVCTEAFEHSRQLRESGFRGIVVLVTHDLASCGGTSNITSEGFDNFLLFSDGQDRIRDTIQWALLNRKRRNKYSIMYDENPEMFFTLDRTGRIFDLNRHAVKNTGLTPKRVVKTNITVSDLGTIPFFNRVIQPIIRKENVSKVFRRTVEEGETIYQVNIMVHNVPTLGLVATVGVSDVTRTLYSHTLDLLMNSVAMLSQRDNYTAQHSSRVYHYCTMIIREMHLSGNTRLERSLYFAALLHDIGKIGIRDNVLLKPGKLSRTEMKELCTHPVKGYKMLSHYKFLDTSGELVLHHHERPDGLGYPNKLKGNKIPLGAAIIAVADSFDAMTSNRPYRRSLVYETAITEIREHLGTQFHADAASAFLSIITPEVYEEVHTRARMSLGMLSEHLIDTLMSN